LKERREKGGGTTFRRSSRSKSRGQTNNEESGSDQDEDGYETMSDSEGEGQQSRPKSKRATVRVVDMTQAFDGELLIALGILLEEDIRFHVEAHGTPSDLDEMDEIDGDGSDDDDDLNHRSDDVAGGDDDETSSGTDEKMDDT